MSSAKAAAARPQRLPIQVPLRPGESVDSFIRRLAIANHLRPSYLRTYLNHPPGGIGSIQVSRLAPVTGRTAQALTYVFPGLNPARLRRDPPPSTPTRPAAPPTASAKRAATTDAGNGHDPKQTDVATAIRRHAAQDELVNRLSRQFAVPRRTIINALTGQAPHADKRTANSPILEPFAGQIDLLLAADPDATIWSIWKTLVEEHHAAVSYATMRNYVSRTRAQAADARSAQHLVDRARLFELIRREADGDDLVSRLTALLSVDHIAVIQALREDASLPLKPNPTLGNPQRHRTLTPQLRSDIDALVSADPEIRVRSIWVRLVNDHPTEVSYATVREYVARQHRPPSGVPRPLPRIFTSRLRSHIDAMVSADPEITILDIWARLIDDHDAEVSYGTVREYVGRQHRPADPRTANGTRNRIARSQNRDLGQIQ